MPTFLKKFLEFQNNIYNLRKRIFFCDIYEIKTQIKLLDPIS